MDFRTDALGEWKQIHEYVCHGWLYRGQRDTSWSLKTTLERFFDRRDIQVTKYSFALDRSEFLLQFLDRIGPLDRFW